MLKQVDVKQVDWQKVADGTGINTAQSARSRYGRFRKQIESQIDGDAIQAKREQEEEDVKNVLSGAGSEGLDMVSANPVLAENTGADVRRVVKSEFDFATPIKQEPRAGSPLFVNDDDNDHEDMEMSSSTSTNIPYINVKAESGIDYDFSDCLVKQEVIFDDPPSIGDLLPHYYDSSSTNLDQAMPSSSIMPRRSTISTSATRQRRESYKGPWATSDLTGNQSSPFNASRASHAQEATLWNAGNGSAEEPFSID